MRSAAWMLLAYGCGSLPFSLWIGRLFLQQDIRDQADRNPGATNVLRAGGRGSAGLALALAQLREELKRQPKIDLLNSLEPRASPPPLQSPF